MAESRMSAHEERRVAVEAGVDPRTVRAFLLGRKQSSTTAGRIRETLLKLGHGALLVPVPGDVAGVPVPEAGAK
jgi:hypothetical protein